MTDKWLWIGIAVLLLLSITATLMRPTWAASCVSTCDQYGCVTICL